MQYGPQWSFAVVDVGGTYAGKPQGKRTTPAAASVPPDPVGSAGADPRVDVGVRVAVRQGGYISLAVVREGLRRATGWGRRARVRRAIGPRCRSRAPTRGPAREGRRVGSRRRVVVSPRDNDCSSQDWGRAGLGAVLELPEGISWRWSRGSICLRVVSVAFGGSAAASIGLMSRNRLPPR